jgi:signal transduction histidine kinase
MWKKVWKPMRISGRKEQRVGMRPSHLGLVAAAGAAGVTLLAALGPFDVAYRNLALHAAIETAAALVASLAALLLFGRFRERGRLGDLVLACALVGLAVTNLFLAALPVIAGATPGRFWTWAPVTGRVLAAAALAASPFLFARVVRDRRRALAVGLGAVGGVVAVVAFAVAAVASRLPAGVDAALVPQTSSWPHGAHALVLATHAASALLFATGAVGFMRRAGTSGDELLRWVGLGTVVAAFAQANYVLYPSLYASWVSTGDALRLVFYVLVVVGAVREIAAYQRERANAAVVEERRRIAREMHDGLAQELACVLTQARLLTMRQPGVPGVAEIESAAQRALDESRLAIAALTRPGYEPLAVAVAAAAEEVARRAGVNVRFKLTDGIEVSAERRDAMVRIVREAVTNAVRHANADEVTVELSNGDGIRLSVVDRGTGFEPAEVGRRGHGFGLTSMRERAESLGGRLTIDSRPGAGTRVEVSLP